MERMKKISAAPLCRCLVFAALLSALLIAGCGYSTRSLLPPEFKTIFVDNVVNGIRITAEQSNLRMYRGYRPGMEVQLTKAIIDRYLFDGNLKTAPENKADLILKTMLIDYKRDALRYDGDDNVEEYRIKLIVNMELVNAKTGALVWQEKGFAGEKTYNVVGRLAMGEEAALAAAMEDLARRIVERTIEAW
jgi:outer membrane lipopolysaccharide assembly protein LptE/RlpB